MMPHCNLPRSRPRLALYCAQHMFVRAAQTCSSQCALGISTTRTASIIFVAVFVSGCTSIAYDEEIRSFKTSTDSVVSTMKSYVVEKLKVRALNDFRQELENAQGKVQIRADSNCDIVANDSDQEDEQYEPKNTACSLEFCVLEQDKCRKLKAGKLYDLYESDADQAAIQLLDLLATYAAGLENIASAENAKKVDVALNQLSGTVVQFGKSLEDDQTGQTELESKLSPITTIFSWIAGKRLQQKKWTALRNATKTVHPRLASAKPKLAEISVHLRNAYARVLLNQETYLDNVVNINGKGDSLQEIEKVYSRMRKIEALLNSNPSGTIDAMLNAHEALTAAISDPDRQTRAVIVALGEFKKSVDDLHKAFQASDGD